MSASAPTRDTDARVQLVLEGMSCAACATRIERKLNKLDGVDAHVNYATEQAAVSYDAGRVELADLVRAVEAAGYRATRADQSAEATDRAAPIRRRLLVSAVLTAPLVALTMLSPLQFE